MGGYKQHGQHARRQGIAVVELALVLPLLLAIVLGTLEASRAMHVKQILSDACRAAGRLAVQSNVSVDQVRDCARRVLEYNRLPAGAVTVSVNGTTVSDLSSAVEGDDIRVTVTVPASSVGYIMPLFIPSESLLSSSIVMRRQK